MRAGCLGQLILWCCQFIVTLSRESIGAGSPQSVTFTPTLLPHAVVTVSLESDEDLIVRENETNLLSVCADLDYAIDFQFSVNFVLKSTEGDGKI